VPRFFHDDCWPAEKSFGDGFGDLKAWAKNHSYEGSVTDISLVMAHLVKQGVKSVGSIAFCWGTYMMLHASTEEAKWPGGLKISAGVGYHPSHSMLTWMGYDEKKLLESVACPQLMVPAGNDHANVKPGGLAQQVFNKKPWGKDCKFVEFPDRAHGWVVRDDIALVKKNYDEAFQLGLQFLTSNVQ